MKIVIPMSGTGERFVVAGYKVPKPLIRIEGRPIIDYVVSMFPGEHERIFICNNIHAKSSKIKEILHKIDPKAKILTVDQHKKGPVYSVIAALEEIGDEEEVMVSYCDYYMEWDFKKFLEAIADNDVAGAIPSYNGFHPHLLRGNLYAGVVVDEKGTMSEIKEKHRFTEDPMDGWHSAGAYYFKRGSDIKKYFRELIDLGLHLNGEYYVSMVYYLFMRDGLKVHIPSVKKFMQWGTPEDLEEFEAWSRHFRKESGWNNSINDIPLERQEKIVIPYPKDSKEFLRSKEYWRDYFERS